MFKKTKFTSTLAIAILCCLIWTNLKTNSVSQNNFPINLNNLSLSSFGVVSEDIEFEELLIVAGTPISSILTLGSFDETDLPNLILGFIFDQVGIRSQEISLEQLPFLEGFTIAELASFIPGLSSLRLNTVPVFSALIEQYFGGGVLDSLGNQTIGALLNRNNIANLLLGDLTSLSSFSVSALPGLTNTMLSNIPGWELLNIELIPGLDLLPIRFFASLPTVIPLAIMDIAFGEAEGYRMNSISGSYQEGFNVPCNHSNCAHIELGPPLSGKQWISGRSSLVQGGSGCLRGREPTGRHPLGRFAKVVLIDTNEANGTALFALYFRFSLFCGKSPYIIGPFPFYQAREKDLIIV